MSKKGSSAAKALYFGWVTIGSWLPCEGRFRRWPHARYDCINAPVSSCPESALHFRCGFRCGCRPTSYTTCRAPSRAGAIASQRTYNSNSCVSKPTTLTDQQDTGPLVVYGLEIAPHRRSLPPALPAVALPPLVWANDMRLRGGVSGY